MLNHPTLEKLKELKLHGMARALEEQLASERAKNLSFEERLGLLVDREATDKDTRRLSSRLKRARLRLPSAVMEDIDLKASRGLDRSLVNSLASCDWVRKKQNVLITGATGSGKTYLACALGHQSAREGFRIRYFRAGRLFQELGIARGDGRYAKVLEGLSKADVLILDDWGLSSLGDLERMDLLEVMEDRHALRSTIIASQLPLEKWHETIGNQTIADAVLDRLIHNAHTLNLKTKNSMRERKKDD
ncbi:MAG: IS21-like element helper ATPase IstB [Candidatus Omnitrophota bacterium]